MFAEWALAPMLVNHKLVAVRQVSPNRRVVVLVVGDVRIVDRLP